MVEIGYYQFSFKKKTYQNLLLELKGSPCGPILVTDCFPTTKTLHFGWLLMGGSTVVSKQSEK